MNSRKSLTLITALLVLLGLYANFAHAASATAPLQSYLKGSLTPDEEFIVATNSAKALRHFAAARRDIVRKNIPAAQSELGKALTIGDGIKSRFVTARLQELVAAARIRLTYEEPAHVLAYLESITPVIADIREPGALKEANRALERVKGFLKNNDKEAADRELVALADVLIYKTATRPLALAEKNLLKAASELDKRGADNAERLIAKAEVRLEVIATQMDTPLSQTQKHLWQATVDYAASQWSDVKADLERAARVLEQALKGANTVGRGEIQDLYRDIQGMLNKFGQSQNNLAHLIGGFWQRSESLVERALDYQTAAWAKFQSSSPGAANLIEAKLHVTFGEIYEFTTRENDKARAELEKAESYVRMAESQVNEKAKSKLAALINEIAAIKADLGKNLSTQKERYASLEDTLSQLIHYFGSSM